MKGLPFNWATTMIRLNLGRARQSTQDEESGGEW